MKILRHPRRRTAFTIVEMLVSAALCMFIMVILTGAFQSAIEIFRQLRSAGQLADKLRTATAVIRKDLASPHFAGEFQQGLSGPNLSDQRLDKIGWMPPQQGYFQIKAPPVSSEGADSEGVPSTMSPAYPLVSQYDPRHYMSMTVLQSGTTVADCFQASLQDDPSVTGTLAPPRALSQKSIFEFGGDAHIFSSRWGQVSYFLAKSPTDPALAGTRQLWTLYRRQTAVLPDTAVTIDAAGVAANPGVTVPNSYIKANKGNQLSHDLPTNNVPTQFLTAQELTIPRYTARKTASTNYRQKGNPTWNAVLNELDESIDHPLLNEVISFEIRAVWDSILVTDPNANNPIAGTFPLHSNYARLERNMGDALNAAATTGLPTAVPTVDKTTNPAMKTDAESNYPFRQLPRFSFRPYRTAGGFEYRDLPGTMNTAWDTTQANPPVFATSTTPPPVSADYNYANFDETRMQFSYIFDTWTRQSSAAQFPNLKYVNWNDASQVPPTPAGTYAAGRPLVDAFNPVPKNPNNVPLSALVPWDDRPPMRIRIRAIEIKLRIWDAKAGQARQVTIMQDV